MGHKLWLTAWVLRQLFRRLFRHQPISKPYSDRQWTPRGADPFDVPTAIVLRIGHGFSSVVEIGAAGGDRIAAVKKALPSVNAIGMDIGADYATDRFLDGVTFTRYAPDTIEPHSLVFCVGTMCCMSEREVTALMTQIVQRDCSLLFFEPQTPLRRPGKRSAASWYHLYHAIARQCGLVDASPQDPQWAHTDSLKSFEQWRGMLFTRPGGADAHRSR